ncbi:Aspartyl aminopeptidase [Desulfomicrobium norvegicum]|uniref:M18 family aminopeptidase n=1 Tax=Desulfomicrobium norvegicum (strain DSM 1741 / NCIMB 8310) TaxID=52561 RepID=A0A8G2BZK1_DESNO|nr:aminopeptidase [Desulfomicrobium norvegicum]SFL25993.1 Aspartyl aminopeptidase [Desulfomicrobium norvegicum]
MDEVLKHKAASCWERYMASDDRAAMDLLANEFLDFLTRCKTERETIAWVAEQAAASGFSDDLHQELVILPFRSKAAILARRGAKPLAEGLRLITAHADTPHLDLKQHPLHEECQVALMKTHYYGGLKKYQWLARPLALHGTIVAMDGRVIPVCIGEDEADPVFTVLDLLPHLARKQREETVEKAFVAEKLNIAIGHEPAETDEDAKVRQRVLELLYGRYAIREVDLYSAELQIVPSGRARFVGLDRALLGGYGQDDRLCVFAAFKAFMDAPRGEHTQILLLWDKEEIGSDGATGAKSRFMEYALADILDVWEPGTRLRHVLARTKAVSADVHCPMDPDYQDVHDKYNASLLGFGPVFSKFTGHGGKYGASEADCEYVAWFRALLAAENIPWQMAEMGKVDEGGGGTVAKELAIYGMEIIDFGPGVLSMHSPFEISSKADLLATVQAYNAFYRS